MTSTLELAPVAQRGSTPSNSSFAVGEDLSLEFLDAMLEGEFENSIPPIWNETTLAADHWVTASIPPDPARIFSPSATESIPPISMESIPPFASDSIPPIIWGS